MNLERLLAGEMSLPPLAAIRAELERRGPAADWTGPLPREEWDGFFARLTFGELDELVEVLQRTPPLVRDGVTYRELTGADDVFYRALVRRTRLRAAVGVEAAERGGCLARLSARARAPESCSCLERAVVVVADMEVEMGTIERAVVAAGALAKRLHRASIREARRKARADRRRASRRGPGFRVSAPVVPSASLVVGSGDPDIGITSSGAESTDLPDAPGALGPDPEPDQAQEPPKVQPPRRRSRRPRSPLSDREVAEFNARLGYDAPPSRLVGGRTLWEQW